MTERALDATLKASAESTEFNYCVLIDLAFPSGNVRLHNSVGTLNFGGNDYFGVGGFGSIDAMIDTLSLVDQPIKLTLSSITQDIIDAIKIDDIYDRDCDIYIGALDADGQLEGTPDNWVSGYMENSALMVGSQNAVTISIKTRASKLRQRNNRRQTLEHHQIEFPTDRFYEFLPYTMNADVEWGGDKVRIGFTNLNDNLDGSGGTSTGGTIPPWKLDEGF